jgi:hypothetical protein
MFEPLLQPGPMRSLGFSSASDHNPTALSPAEADYSVPLALPNEFLQVEDQIVKIFSKITDAPVLSLPSKHNSGHQLPDNSQRTSCVPPWTGCAAAELSLPCSGPTMAPTFSTFYCDADCAPSPSRSGTGRRSFPPAINPCMDDTAKPGIPCRWGRPPSTGEVAKSAANCHGGLLATKRVSYSDLLVSMSSK